MRSELIINSKNNLYRIALLKEDKLIEYHTEEKDNKFTVGDIYLGTVKNVVSGLNAAFVDIGGKRDTFLHYLDLNPKFHTIDKFLSLALKKEGAGVDISKLQIEPDLDKQGSIQDILKPGKHVLVQVVKEPISTKGPRLSCEISFAGRYCILMPFSEEISISRRIKSISERKRLYRLFSSIKPKNFGVIVRTASEGKEVAELDRDLKDLFKKWQDGSIALENAVPKQKIIGEVNRASTILRDILNESFDRITVDDQDTYLAIKGYIKKIAPEKEKIVRVYKGHTKIFEKYKIERKLKGLFGQVVSLEGGGYIVVEHTEAMHVIDVNSGNRSYSTGEGQENTAFTVNSNAVKEIARQLRLRDMGGIIVVDFIDMRNPDHKTQIYQMMKDELKEDRSKTSILRLSKLCIMQITRQRVRPETNIVTKEQCPSCGGTGQIDASIVIADKIEKDLHYLISNQNESGLTIYLHPFLLAYFTKGTFSRRFKWFMKYKTWITLRNDSSLGITGYKFYSNKGREIILD